MKFTEYQYDFNCTTDELLTKVHELNKDPTVHGIIVQLPLGKQINESLLLSSIHPVKDVDGVSPINLGRLTTMENELCSILQNRKDLNIYDQVSLFCQVIME